MKLAKVLLTGLAIPSVALPLTTLASCGTSWGNKTPFMIGSILDGPYSWLMDDATFYDKDGNDIDYLQNQYAIQPKTSSNFAYSIPFKFDSAQNKWTQTGEAGWYASGNEAFAMTATGSDGKEVKSVANATLSPNVDFVSSIGASVTSFVNYALQYQAQQIKKDDDTNLNIAWGGGEKAKTKFTLKHGTKESDQNKQFIEYIFASSNLNGKEKSKAQLKTANVHFHFDEMPIPTYNNDETKSISQQFIDLIENASDLNDPQYATSDVEQEEKEGDVTYKYKVYTYDAVPVKLHLDGISDAYLNPTIKDDSFLVNDFYSSTSEIKESIGNQWKETMPDFTSYSKDECVPHYQTFNIATQEVAVNPGTENIDARIGSVNGRDFIALVGYSVRICAEHPEKNSATISGLQNLFPAYFLNVYGETIFKKNAKDKWVINQDELNKGINKWLELVKRTGGSGYETDLTKLDEEHQSLLTFLGYMFGSDNKDVNTDQILTASDPI